VALKALQLGFWLRNAGLARATLIGTACTDGALDFQGWFFKFDSLRRNNGNSSIPFQHSIFDLIHPFETLQLASGGQDI
jgi:hypothetical protein